MTWIKVASVKDIREGNGKELNVNGQRIALFVSKQKYYAIEALQHELTKFDSYQYLPLRDFVLSL